MRSSASLTVGLQGSCQHLDALVSDGISGRQVRRQWSPSGGEAGRRGAGRGGGSFWGIGFSLSVEGQIAMANPILVLHLVSTSTSYLTH